MAYELGEAYVSISIASGGLAGKIRKEIGLGSDEGSRAASSNVTSRFSGAFKAVGRFGAAAVGTVGAAVAGMAVGGGLNRALQIDNAKASLKGLKLSMADIDSVMKSANDAVDGTAFGLGEAAGAASLLKQAGIGVGDQMTRQLTLIADTATQSGREISHIAPLWNKMAAAGKVTWGNLSEMNSNNIPGLAALSKHLGKSQEEVIKLASQGQISFEEFSVAMEKYIGGAAQASGQTFVGAMKNMRAALSRIGEKAVLPFLNLMRNLAPTVIAGANTVKDTLAPVFERFGITLDLKVLPKMEKFIDTLVNGIKNLDFSKIKALAPIIAALSGALLPLLGQLPLIGGAFAGITLPVGLFLSAAGTLIATSPALRGALGSILESVKNLFGAFTQAGGGVKGFQAVLARLPQEIAKIIPAIGGIIIILVDMIIRWIPRLVTTVTQIIEAIVKALPQLLTGIINAITTLLPRLVTAAVDLVKSLAKALPPVIETLGRAIVDLMPTVVNAALQLFTSIVEALPQILPPLIQALTSLISAVVSSLASFIPLLISAGVQLFVALVGALPTIINVIVAALPAIITSIVEALLSALPQLIEAGVKLLTALIEALPQIITVIVGALPQIITAIITALTGAIPQLIGAGIQLFIALVKAIPQIIPPLVGAIPQIIGAIVNGLGAGYGKIFNVGKDLIKGLWGGIKDMGSWILGKIKDFAGMIVDGIKGFFGIHSPSRIFAGIGENLAAGLGVGWEKEIGAVEARISSSLPDFTAPQVTYAGIAPQAFPSPAASFAFPFDSPVSQLASSVDRLGGQGRSPRGDINVTFNNTPEYMLGEYERLQRWLKI